MSFNVKIAQNENLEVSLTGDLDINSVETFKSEVLEIYQDTDIIFDLSNLEYLDSTGLGAFISIYSEVNSNGKSVTIKNAKNNIKKLFLITELDQLFNLED